MMVRFYMDYQMADFDPELLDCKFRSDGTLIPLTAA